MVKREYNLLKLYNRIQFQNTGVSVYYFIISIQTLFLV